MTCCVGKARVFYKEPLHFKLIYSGSANGEVTAPEPLTTTCLGTQEQNGSLYKLVYSYSGIVRGCSSRNQNTYSSFSGGGTVNNLNPPVYMERGESASTCFYWPGIPVYTLYYRHSTPPQTVGIYIQSATGIWRATTLNFTATVSRMDGLEDPFLYTFKVIGTETGTVYREIGGLEECPAVENLGCVMGEERYYDTLLPDQSPGGLVESSCFKKVTDPSNPDCFHVVLETKYKNIADKLPAPPKIRSQLYLCGLPGCPAEYRIECCPDGECDPPKCPPDTDCELDCGNFICCYKNGKVIRTIQKT